MATKIEWCDETWNPTVGCKKVSAGCKNCYAERMACRLARMGQDNYLLVTHDDVTSGWTGHVKCLPERLDIPLKWKKPRRIFVNSMSDLFHEDVPDEFIDDVFNTMYSAGWHTFIILTKRPERMSKYMHRISRMTIFKSEDVWSNVHLGVSISNQTDADNFIPWLLRTPAAVRIVSVEPMLGPINFGTWLGDRNHNELGTQPYIDWVIAGCESGPNRRPMDIGWARDLRLQCDIAHVPFFLKQMEVNGKIVKMPELDGVVWNQYPGEDGE